MAPTPSLSAHGKQELTRILEDAASRLSGVAFTVASAAQDTLLFEGYAGSVDVLDPASRPLTNDTFMFFASTTKLLTSVSIEHASKCRERQANAQLLPDRYSTAR